MRLMMIVLIAGCLFSGCKKEDNPLSPTAQDPLTVKVENDSLVYSLTIPKSVYSPGDSLNALFSIQNKTNNFITFPFDSTDLFYLVLNDSSRVVMSYPKVFNSHGFFKILANSWFGFTITALLHDDLNIPIRPGSYTLSVRVEFRNTPTLTQTFSVK